MATRKPSNDRALIASAITALTEGNQTAFGKALGYADGRQVRAWLARDTPLEPALRTLLASIVAHPREWRAWLLR